MTVYMTGNHIIQSRAVAPHVGAWIETSRGRRRKMAGRVAPHVGAWIETQATGSMKRKGLSLPMWERGLKLLCQCPIRADYPSRSPCGSVD